MAAASSKEAAYTWVGSSSLGPQPDVDISARMVTTEMTSRESEIRHIFATEEAILRKVEIVDVYRSPR